MKFIGALILTACVISLIVWFYSPGIGGISHASEETPNTTRGKQHFTPTKRNLHFPQEEGAPRTTKAPSRAKGEVLNGRISADEISDFTVYTYPIGIPYYTGEKTTAYVRVPSSQKQQALTVNQEGEYPRMMTKPGETVQVRLAFTETAPDTPIAITAHDGGRLDKGLRATALLLDEARQLAFSFTVSTNPGIHRVTFRTPAGETKTLEFWAGPLILAEKPR